STAKRLARLVALVSPAIAFCGGGSQSTSEGLGRLFHSVPPGSSLVIAASVPAMSRPEFFTLLNEARRNVILKLGQFSFSQQDLVIPVAGIPLTVVRTYNSLNLRRGDFGYGWTYAIRSGF